MELQRFLARMGMHIEDSRRKVSDDDFFFLIKRSVYHDLFFNG